MLHRTLYTAGLLALCASAGAAHADIPQMGGGMSHLLVSVFNQQVFVTFESPSMSTVELQEGSGSFEGSASVLDGTGHNAQFGWLANGFISLPPSSGVFVRLLETSPHLSVYSEFGHTPILGTDGSSTTWQWGGAMTHNWYASDVMGPHHVSYEVFVGDLLGNPLEGWTSGTVDLGFLYGTDLSDRIGTRGSVLAATVPSPGSIGVLMGLALAGRRRR